MSDPKPQTNLYTVGGAVQAGGGLYLPRRADNELLELCRAGAFSYVLTPRQLGKTSLMVRTAERLGEEGVRSVIIDLTQIGVQVTVENWYLGLLAVIEDQLLLETSAVEWWKARGDEGMTQRLVEFFKDVALKEVEGRLVVFVDEIDTTLSLPFTDDFYAAVRYFYNARAHTPELKRLSFVLIGVATPGDLVRDPQRTPFNIGHRVDLTDFTFDEALPLAAALGLPLEESRRVLAWVLEWTGGHPYLTQRLCRAVAEERRENWTREDVERLTASVFFGEMSEKDNNLQFVRDMLTKRAPDPAGVLSTYREVLRGRRPVPDEEQSIVKSHLKLSGIVYRKQGTLHVRNPIYAKVFDSHWIAQHLPVNWTKRLQRIAAALALLVLLGLIPLSIYAFSQARQANNARAVAESRRVEAEKSSEEAKKQAEIAEARRLDAETQGAAAVKAQKEADKQRKNAEEAAVKERAARAEAEKQKQIAEEQRARAEGEAEKARQSATAATASELKAIAARDEADEARREAERLRQLAFGGQLGALAEVTRNQQSNLLQRSAMIARASILQSPDAPPLIGYQALTQAMSLLPRLAAELPTQPAANVRNAFTADNKYLLSVSEDPQQTAAALSYTARVLDVNDGYREIPSLTRRAPVKDSAFSPDLTHLATKKGDGTVSVTNLTTGNEEPSFASPSGVTLLTLSSGGRFAAFVESDESTVHVRDLKENRDVSWKMEASADGKQEAVQIFRLSFSPTGKYLQVDMNLSPTRAGGQWTQALREVSTGREVNRREASKFTVGTPDVEDKYYFSYDDKVVAVLDGVDIVVVQDADFSTPRATFRHPSLVRRIVFSPAEYPILATIEADNTLRVWDIAENVAVASVKLDDEATDLVFSRDGQLLAATNARGSVRVWDKDVTSEVTRVLQDDLSDFDFGPGGKLVTADNSGKLRVWEPKSEGDFIHKTMSESVTTPLLTPNGRYLVERGSPPRIWDTSTSSVLLTEAGGEGDEENDSGYVIAVGVSPDGKYVANTQSDGVKYGVKVWETASKRVVREIKLEDVGQEIAVSAGGKYVAAIFHGDDKDPASRALVWEVATGKVAATVEHEDDARVLAFSPDAKYFASGGKTIQVTRLDGGPQNIPPVTNQNSVVRLAFSPGGKYLVIASADLKVWERDTGRAVTLAETKYNIESFAFSGDGRYLAVADVDVAHVLDIAAAIKAPQPFNSIMVKLDNDVFAVALTHNGDYLATISGGNYARIWDIRNRREVARLPYRSTESNKDVVAFTGDNDKYLVAAHDGGVAEVWLWRPADLARASCSRLTLKEPPVTFLSEYLDAQLLKNMPLLSGCTEQK